MDSGASFLSSHYVKSSWVAFFTLWVLWGIVYFLRHAFGSDNVAGNGAANGVAETDTEVAATGTKRGWRNFGNAPVHSRLSRAHQILFENSLMLLSVLTLNTFGAGATRAVMILSWVFFAFTAINAFTEVAVNHHFIRFIFSIIFFAITLAIGGLAFSQGWF